MAIVFSVKPWYKKGQNLDKYFDPTTHVASLDNFIKFLDDGIYTSEVIGYRVTLSTNRNWIIADLNHDSQNTEQTNCYDLISGNLYPEQYLNSGNVMSYWSVSDLHSYLNKNNSTGFYGNYIPSKIKNRMLKLKYYSHGYLISTDYVTLPSLKEVGINDSSSDIEGVTYPIFNSAADRIKRDVNGYTESWWTRTAAGSQYWYNIISSNGSQSVIQPVTSATYCLLPIIRVH